jgi:hypothetical protein
MFVKEKPDFQNKTNVLIYSQLQVKIILNSILNYKWKSFSTPFSFVIDNHSQLPPQGSNENCSQYVIPVAQIFSEFKVHLCNTICEVVQIFSDFKLPLCNAICQNVIIAYYIIFYLYTYLLFFIYFCAQRFLILYSAPLCFCRNLFKYIFMLRENLYVAPYKFYCAIYFYNVYYIEQYSTYCLLYWTLFIPKTLNNMPQKY